jgi:hypothetical protein
VGATCIKCGDIGGGIAKASGMPDCTGVASEMADPTGMWRIVLKWLSQAKCHMEWLSPLELLRLLK